MTLINRFFAAAMATLVISLALPATAASPVPSAKLDATLAIAARDNADGVAASPALTLRRFEPGRSEPLIQTILRFEGNLDAVKAQGAVVRSVMGNIATVDIPASKLTAVAALPDVVSIEAARKQTVRLDVSVPATRADALRTGTAPTWTGGTGKGVIVGIADTGVDFRHRDLRNADGTTRLLGLFDQRTSGATGSPPAPLTYGGECTPAMINAAIAGDPTACAQRDTNGHGTHVAGIAAGNGQATGNGQLSYRMIGMAPDADLLATNNVDTTGGDAATLDAIAYMKARAQALGKPLVVNISFGSYYGARDGTSNFQQGLNNLAGPGVILVAAAGNESNVPIRATGTITQGGSVTVTFNVPATNSEGSPFTSGALELWIPGNNAYSTLISAPECGSTPSVGAGLTGTFPSPCGVVKITALNPNPLNDDRQIFVELSTNATVTALRPGTWSITLVGDVVAGGSAPFSIISGEDAGGITFTSNLAPQTTEILTDTSSARRVIAVASYNTKYAWNSLAGSNHDHWLRAARRPVRLQQSRATAKLQQPREVPGGDEAGDRGAGRHDRRRLFE